MLGALTSTLSCEYIDEQRQHDLASLFLETVGVGNNNWKKPEARKFRERRSNTAPTTNSDGDLRLPQTRSLDSRHIPMDARGGNSCLTDGRDGRLTKTAAAFNIVTLNVAGLRFQTFVETLERYPGTLLGDEGKRSVHFNPGTGEYFFDRHRACFESILYFYQSGGRLKRPEGVPVDIFVRELKFFEMGNEVMARFWELEGYRKPKEAVLPRNRLQRRVWLVMEHPDSSLAARVMALFSVFVVMLSTFSFCLETLPDLKASHNRTVADYSNETEPAVLEEPLEDTTTGSNIHYDQAETFDNPFFVVEFTCMCWFTLEFMLRLMSCPCKLHFCKSFLNIIDFVAIVPFFVNMAWAGARGAGGATPPFGVLRVFRLVRVFRIFKLSRHSRGLQILGKTFAASVQELCLLVFFLALGLVLFSSAMYIAEAGNNSGFDSIPASFWYVIITMTTVGYGDLTPKGVWGKLVGGTCAIVGVLVLALPVPVIVANFKHYYRQETRLAHMRALESDENDEDFCDDDSRTS